MELDARFNGAGCGVVKIRLQLLPVGEDANSAFAALEQKVDEWIENRGYTVPALTIQQLAAELGTNRTYLSDYVNSKYSLTFRNWIAQLRIDYSKRLLIGNSALSINTIAEMTGYSLSLIHI